MGNLPEFRPLNALVDHVVGGGTPSRGVSRYWQGGIPWASVKDLSDDPVDLTKTQEHISPAGLASSSAKIVPAEIPIVCTRMAVGRATIPELDVAINQDLKALYPAEDTYARYLLHCLRYIKPSVEAIAIGSTVRGVSVRQLLEIEILAPKPTEQRWIAEVLDTVDEGIHKTERTITKLRLVKQSLLDDLITFGVDRTGKPRNSIHKPEQFYNSPIGLIPQRWRCMPLRCTLEHLIDFRGRTPRKLGMGWSEGSILALSANNVKTGRIDTSGEAYYGSEALYRRWMTQGDTRRGDILLTLEAPLGNVAQVPDHKRYILSQRVVLLRFNPTIMTNDFAFWYIQSARFQQAMNRTSTGTTATGIRRAQLERLHVACPGVDEQKIVVDRMSTLEDALRSESLRLRKLKMLKEALASALLSGQVRVPAQAIT